MSKFDFETVLVEAARLPLVRIDREDFLRKELRGRYSHEIIEKAIEYNPAYAGIKVEEINKIARVCIASESIRVTTISAAAGIPGGFAMIGTIPADFVQYFGHILRIVQELIYLYGWQDLKLDDGDIKEETKIILTLFVGVMLGANGASNAVKIIAEQLAKTVAKRLPRKALTKGIIYPIVKNISKIIGVKMTKTIFAKGVSKAVPLAGAIISGGLTLASFAPMAEKLRKHLESTELAEPENFTFSINKQNEAFA